MSRDWDAMAVVGRVARAHGTRGEVIVNPDTDFPERRFRAGAEFFVRRRGEMCAVRVTTARLQQGRPIIGLEGVGTMNEAGALAGCELRVPVEDLAPLPDGSYYHHDLVGCRVETRAGAVVGTVVRVEGAPGSSRLVVESNADEVLVPLVAGICVMIDVGARVIVLDPPDGLLDLNATRARPARGTR